MNKPIYHFMDPINDIDIQDEDVKEEDFSSEQLLDENVDWKSKALELKGIAKRRATQLAKLKEAQKAAKAMHKIDEDANKPDKKNKPEKFSLGEKAFLRSYGITNEEEMSLVKQEKDKSGDELDILMENPYFKSKLDALRTENKSKEAMPPSKRSSSQAGDSFDYHYAQYKATGKLPEDRELREKVVLEREKEERNSNMFTDEPVVG